MTPNLYSTGERPGSYFRLAAGKKKPENDRNKRRNSLQIYYIMIYSLLAGAVARRTNKDQADRNFPKKNFVFHSAQ